ncbi:hypothetical protein GGR57DRAFT_75331 [Xylariaceae sp. FL1272]|nr:hypothetical protein GGR57DRAFT_75331 [Xylariaceae sp. FL1272]
MRLMDLAGAALHHSSQLAGLSSPLQNLRPRPVVPNAGQRTQKICRLICLHDDPRDNQVAQAPGPPLLALQQATSRVLTTDARIAVPAGPGQVSCPAGHADAPASNSGPQHCSTYSVRRPLPLRQVQVSRAQVECSKSALSSLGAPTLAPPRLWIAASEQSCQAWRACHPQLATASTDLSATSEHLSLSSLAIHQRVLGQLSTLGPTPELA